MNESEKQAFINNFENYIFNCATVEQFLYDLISHEDYSKIIIDNDLYWKNFKVIIDRFKIDGILKIFDFLCLKDKNNKIMNEEMYVLFNNNTIGNTHYDDFFRIIKSKNKMSEENLGNLIEHILKNKSTYINVNFIKYLYSTNYKNIVDNNLYAILNNLYDIFELRDLIKEDENQLNKLNSYINNNPSKLIYKILMDGFQKSLDEIKGEKIFDTLKTIIDEVLLNEDKQYSDIEFLDSGQYSYVLAIGNKVLKVGEKRKVFLMENNRRFLKPVLRTEIDSIKGDEILGCIEITEKVNTEGITKEDVRVLYEELKGKGYIWGDCTIGNVGRLTRKNKVYFDDLNPTKESIDYTTDNLEELEAGELVIIDNDHIFTKAEFAKQDGYDKEYYLGRIKDYDDEYKSKTR